MIPIDVERVAAHEIVVEARADWGVAAVQWRTGDRGWRTRRLGRALFDGTQASFDRWKHAGAGSMQLVGRAMRTTGGLGLHWYAAREFGDATFTLQWREARTDGANSNGGVFVRFPGPGPARDCDARLPLALTDFAWHAVACGHELQINDGDVDPQRTGSVYGFRALGPEGSKPSAFGAWNDYAVRTAGAGDYALGVAANGEVVNEFVNAPGLEAANPLYPGTNYKQFATGFFGLQNHGDADTLEYRRVRVLELTPRRIRLRVPRRTVRVRVLDGAGRRSGVASVRPT